MVLGEGRGGGVSAEGCSGPGEGLCPQASPCSGWAGGPVALTAAVRSTSLRLLRIKQASPLSILQNTRSERCLDRPRSSDVTGSEAGKIEPRRTPPRSWLMGWCQDSDQLAGGPSSMTLLSQGQVGAQNGGEHVVIRRPDPCPLAGLCLPRDLDGLFCCPLPPLRAPGCSRGTREVLTAQGREAPPSPIRCPAPHPPWLITCPCQASASPCPLAWSWVTGEAGSPGHGHLHAGVLSKTLQVGRGAPWLSGLLLSLGWAPHTPSQDE